MPVVIFTNCQAAILTAVPKAAANECGCLDIEENSEIS